MVFHSFDFIFGFLPVMLLVYFLSRKSRTLSSIVLLIGSYTFYGYETPSLLIFIIISSTVDYFVAPRIEACSVPKKKKRLLILSLVVNLSMLCILKYTGWLVYETNMLLSYLGFSNHLLPAVDLPLPPGISFYTFQTISYSVDVYRGVTKPTKNLVNFFNYVSFFPQLVAGPIERANRLLPQIEKAKRTVTTADLEYGFILILWGLCLKVVFADNFGHLVDITVHNAWAGFHIISVFAFCFQIFCDFSAYTNIARGVARLFGIKLQRNFFMPYFATSPRDFWKRWHISLSEWIRDYIYIPLGGNRGSKPVMLINLLLTMFLGGLWHGAGLNFIVWGLYQGLLLVFYHILPIDKWLQKYMGIVGKTVSIIIMFHLTLIGWIFFMDYPLVVDHDYLSGSFWPLFTGTWSSIQMGLIPLFERYYELVMHPTIVIEKWPYEFDIYFYALILLITPIVLSELYAFIRNKEFHETIISSNIFVKVPFCLALIYAIIFFGKRIGYDFIYFAF